LIDTEEKYLTPDEESEAKHTRRKADGEVQKFEN
jgi:hypothetical protein